MTKSTSYTSLFGNDSSKLRATDYSK